MSNTSQLRLNDGKTFSEKLMEVPHMVEFWTGTYLKNDTFLKDHGVSHEDIEGEAYKALFNKNSSGVSNIERAFNKAVGLETGDKYLLNYIGRTVLSKVCRTKENKIRKNEPFQKCLYSYEDLVVSTVGLDNDERISFMDCAEDGRESFISVIERKEMLENIPDKSTGYYVVLNDKKVPVTQRRLANLLYAGYTVTDLSKITYNSSGKHIAFNTAKKIITDVKTSLKEYFKKCID